MEHTYKLLAASSIILLLSTTVQGQKVNPACTDPAFSAVNATGALVVPGFIGPPISTPGPNAEHIFPPNNWTVHTAIKEIQDANTSTVAQTFWIDSEPPLNVSANNLTFSGCAIVLQGFSHPRTSAGTNASSSCEGLFDEDCFQAIRNTIVEFGVQNSEWSLPNTCDTVIATPPKECKDYKWTSVAATQPFGNPSFSNTGDGSCKPTNIFQGSATHDSLITIQSNTTQGLSNHTDYDIWVDRATPLILTGFNKGDKSSFSEMTMVCLTADDVVKGSRVPPAGVVSGAGRAFGFDIGREGVVLGVFGFLILWGWLM